MSYTRVLPRDLFNEANLLKCLGRLTLLIEDGVLPGLTYEYDGLPFVIQQSEDDGSISAENLTFTTKNGNPVCMRRPLNSREAWPLIATIGESEYYVFDESGNVMPAFDKL